MIDLQKTRVIISTWPKYAVDHRMTCYLLSRGLPVHNILAADRVGSVIERRNNTIKQHVLPVTPRFDWFLFIDHDHFPEEDVLLDPFFDDIDADIVGCQYPTGNEQSWLTPDIFHMGMVRIRGEVFEKVQPPWFMFEYNEHATKITVCECQYLRAKALALEFKITSRGRVGHASQHTWIH